MCLRIVGREPCEYLSEVQGLRGQLVGLWPGRCPVDDIGAVDRLEDRVIRAGRSPRPGIRKGMRAALMRFFARTRRVAIVDVGTEKAWPTCSAVKPSTVLSMRGVCTARSIAG